MELWMILAFMIVFVSGSTSAMLLREIVKYQKRQIELLSAIEKQSDETRRYVKMLSELGRM